MLVVRAALWLLGVVALLGALGAGTGPDPSAPTALACLLLWLALRRARRLA